MIPGQAQQFFEAAAAQAGGGSYKVDRSLRFNDGDTAELTRTPSSAGNTSTFTLSFWAKRSKVGSTQMIVQTGDTYANLFRAYWDGNDKFRFHQYNGSYVMDYTTEAAYRDVGAWYHYVIAIDTTQAAAADRVKLYVNGAEITDFSASTDPALNLTTGWNAAIVQRIGREYTTTYGNYYNYGGYLAEFYNIDGQQLAASDFGEYDDNNVWQPKEFGGSYGAADQDGTSSPYVFTNLDTTPNAESNVLYLNSNPDASSYPLIQSSVSSNDTIRVKFASAQTGVTSIKFRGGGYSASSSYYLFVNGTQIGGYHSTNSGWGEATHTISSTDITEIKIQGSDGFALGQLKFNDTLVSGTPSYGTSATGLNSFYLKFSDNSSNAALGTDSSGTGNTFTVTNLQAADGSAVTVGAANGGLPIRNTSGDQGGTPVSGFRSDSSSSQLFLALPLNTDTSDVSNSINSDSTTKTITNQSTATSSTQARFYGASSYWNANSDGILVAESGSELVVGTGDFTIELWFYDDSNHGGTGGRCYLFDNRIGGSIVGDPPTITGYVDGSSTINYGTSGGGTISHSLSTDNKWIHFAAVRNSGTTNLYINGTSVGSHTDTTNYTNNGFGIGRATDANYGWAGYIQDFRVYKTAKYTSDFNPPALANPTLGVGCDSLIDTTTDYEADSGNNGGNYCTLNVLDRQSANGTLSNGNLDITQTSAAWAMYRSTMFVSSGKWFWELTIGNNQYSTIGICTDVYHMASATNNWVNGSAEMFGYYPYNGKKYNGGSNASYATADTSAAGSVIGVALDMDNGTLAFYKDGTSLGTAYTGLTGKNVSPTHWLYNQSNADSYNFGQRPFAYTPPTDHLSLCTTNLTDPTIVDPSTAMDALLYTGDGQSSKAVTGYGFSPGFLWIKERSSTSDHGLWNTVVGSSKYLSSNSTSAEFTTTTELNSIDSAGFTVGSSSMTNENSQTYVAWAWETGDTTTTVAKDANGTNLPGATCEYRANTTNGFSVVKVADPQSNEARVHGLGAAPDFFICKSTASADSWHTYWKVLGRSYYINLNGTGPASSSDQFGSQEPDSTYFYVKSNTGSGANKSGGMVYYLWNAVDQYSAFGEYYGNGNADGPFVFTGFRPKWILFKMRSGSGNWRLMDTSRDLINPCDAQLYPDNTDAESSSTAHEVDYLSNGFKVVTSHPAMNSSGQYYLYAAFAEHPFKSARAR